MVNLCILLSSSFHHYTIVPTLTFVVFVSMNSLIVLPLSHKDPAKSIGLPDIHHKQRLSMPMSKESKSKLDFFPNRFFEPGRQLQQR